MVKYFSIAFLINVILFVFYSFWLYNSLTGILKSSKEYVAPIHIFIKTEKVNFQELEKNSQSAEAANTYSNEETSLPKRKLKAKQLNSGSSLINSLEKEVGKDFLPLLSKISTKASATLSRSGKLTLNTNRRLVYIPKINLVKVSVPPAPAEVKITILPDGRVINAVLVKRSGNAKLDELLLRFSKNLKFEPINAPVIQELYIVYTFTIKG